MRLGAGAPDGPIAHGIIGRHRGAVSPTGQCLGRHHWSTHRLRDPYCHERDASAGPRHAITPVERCGVLGYRQFGRSGHPRGIGRRRRTAVHDGGNVGSVGPLHHHIHGRTSGRQRRRAGLHRSARRWSARAGGGNHGFGEERVAAHSGGVIGSSPPSHHGHLCAGGLQGWGGVR